MVKMFQVFCCNLFLPLSYWHFEDKNPSSFCAFVSLLILLFGADTKQWEYISYCLSQLSFTDKGMKKLIELFKTYEHVLCEDLVMDHFKNIINKVILVDFASQFWFIAWLSKVYLKRRLSESAPIELCFSEAQSK